MEQKPTFAQKYPALKDIISFLTFVGAVALGTFILNSFIFRSYSVIGGSMENTLQSGDRVIVNRIPVSIAHFKEEEYVPKRGQIVVFANGGNTSLTNCDPMIDVKDQYIIKRVIAFPGERVVFPVDGDEKITILCHVLFNGIKDKPGFFRGALVEMEAVGGVNDGGVQNMR